MLGLLAFRKRDPEISDAQVCLRAPRTGDFHEWAQLRAASRTFLEPWEPVWTKDELGRLAWRERMRRYRLDAVQGVGYAFFVFERESGRLAGGITLSNIRYGVAQTASIGYWMGEEFAGRGYMPAALELLVSHSFGTLRLHRLEAACIPGNQRSIRVLEKAGFSREGLLKSYLKINGAWQDHYLYARIADRPGGDRN